ncbi:MAG TPA: STAS domain-containing protein [Herpetosiphon sp.]|uniref:Anti-sigma factor antagonist n=2 Tax=Herpetosiphon TaxID=64 RepID=A9B3A3_HERA2|nr:anti-sigma factor antagonist [Herpetosiphon sp.]ABX04066.1 anti-sigma-factor antagonist [Herpetosiphon aurantiacus DSM 785]MCA0353738.1 anti-sigma factor antagonist [Chloroflexota bacterium]HBW49269.1 STAS domain-containing protein [Herpetosiphon sp.]
MAQTAELKLPGLLDSLGALCKFAYQAALDAGLNEHTAWEIELAVDEAATNIIQHAYSAERPGDVRLVCGRDGSRFVVRLFDRGVPFDPETVPPPDLTSSIETREAGGLGMYLMGRMMDDVQFNYNPETGENELHMSKIVGTRLPEDVRVVPVQGRIDATAAPALATIVHEAAETGGRRILLDLTGVTFLSSSGLRILLLLARELKGSNGELRLCSLQPAVAEVFTLTGFTQIFTIHRTRDEALAALADVE